MLRLVLRLLAASLLLVALGAAPVAAGGGCHGEDGSVHTEGDATVVRMGLCSFSPTVAHVPVGTKVRFLNTADVNHLVVGEARTWGTQVELVPGQEIANTFRTAGVYPYSCPLHPGMVGAIVVGGTDTGAAAPPAAAGGALSGAAQAGTSTTSTEPAAQTGTSPAAIVVAVALLGAVVVGGALLWRRQAARPIASREG
jgi:MYXO-CTERM domain-containing protein